MATRADPPPRKRLRIGPAAAVAAVHVAIGYMLLAGLSGTLPLPLRDEPTRLIVIDQPPPPPPEQPRLKPKRAPDPGGAPKAPAPPPPPQIVASPTPALPAPPAIVPVPSPVIATPGAPRAGNGNGAGGGAGGAGSGSGSGSGNGTDGVFTEAEQIKGRFRNSDFPASAKGAGKVRVGVRYAVERSGSVGSCEVTEPSGEPDLDAMTCRVIQQRYIFRPAKNAAGVPVTEVIEEGYTWTLD